MASIKIGAGQKGIRVKGADLLAFVESRREGGPSPAITAETHPDLAKFLRRRAGRPS